MSKRVTISFLISAVAVAALALTSGAASAAPGATKLKVVPIVMKDPGCHWFSVGGKNLSKLSVTGKTAFRNLDETTLIFKGKGFNHRVAVGKTLAVTTPGTYHITMVGQPSDDNTLLLVVK
ncbi:MAG TPA: hypothetical protein VIU16_00015 [Gaiellaceae bacterium]